MKFLQFIIDNKGAISGWILAAYFHIKHAGGYRTIWADLQGPKQPNQVNSGFMSNAKPAWARLNESGPIIIPQAEVVETK